MKNKYRKCLLLLLCLPMLHAFAVTDFQTFSDQLKIIKILEVIPARSGALDAAIYNQGESVKFVTLSRADKSDIQSDPVNIKSGDRFLDIYINDRTGYRDCDFGGIARFTIRKGKYIPQDRTANWFMNNICKAPE